ncbi:HAD family hydrolase [Ferruginibacter sp. SUN106]|uniref:HAD family hydrolase n=1 Tax=Ferruginibacter sp. SUN106 TaxID=2978348 RepID=UPI003D368707
MAEQKVFLFDLNGTVIDDMQFHIQSWYQILNGLGATISLEETKLQCYGKNEELLERIFPGRFKPDEIKEMIIEKERRYQENFRPYLKLIDGLGEFLEEAYQAKIKMAIGSAAIPFNIDYILDGLQLHKYFPVVVSAYDVVESKPHPETFLLCAEKLNVAPADCIVFEDSPKGVEAAARAGMKAVVITTMHTKEEFYGDNIICFIENYSNGLFEKLVS